MLRIIEGSFYSEAREVFYSALESRVRGKGKAILIVPESETVLAESEMTSRLPGDAPMYLEVTNFTRFANVIFRMLGGVDKVYCDSSKCALLMWRTLAELSPMLSMTDGRREINYGMVKRALKTTGESDGLSVGVGELSRAREDADVGSSVSKKLDDLIKITALYKRLLHEKYSDVGEDLGAARERLIEAREAFSDTEIYLDGFISFTEPQIRLIELLIKRTDLTVHFPLPRHAADAFEYSEPLETRSRLSSIAARSSVEVRLDRYGGQARSSALLSELTDLLWRTDGRIDDFAERDGGEISVHEAGSPYDACDYVISDIRRRVREGYSYRELAVVVGDVSKYEGILDLKASRADVPLFISSKKDLSSYEAIKLIYTALTTISGGFNRSDVITYSKCSLSGISREECDLFELYCEAWQINGRRFTDGVMWNMNPDGYGARRDGSTDERLVILNRIRERLITPLTELGDSLAGARTVRELATALYEYLRRIGLSESIKARTRELTRLGEGRLASENERLYKIILDSLDSLVSVSGDDPCDVDGFISQLKILFSSVSVARIPTVYDSVTVGSASSVRLRGKRHIYLLGVNKGEMPGAVSDDSFFTDREKAELSRLGLPFSPDTARREARELYSFSRAISYTQESVDIIYFAKSADYASIRPSDVIARIKDITCGKVEPVRISEICALERIYTPSDALDMLGDLEGEDYLAVREALVGEGYGEEVRISELDVKNENMQLSRAITDMIYEGDLELSQSKIDQYNSCPLAYFCKYDLNLSENERAEFNARNIGSFIHSILENFFKKVTREAISLDTITDSMREELVRECAGIYLESLGEDTASARTSLLIERLIRSADPVVAGLCREFIGSSYVPRYFELRIGGSSELDPEPLVFTDTEGRRSVVRGSVDRVDAYRFGKDVYVRVVDYKTGTKSFSVDDLSKGKNLQMFLYLRAVVDTKSNALRRDLGVSDDGELIPAGVIYVKSDLSDVKISHDSPDDEQKGLNAEQKRLGMLLSDRVSIDAMNAQYLPVRIKKDGNFYSDSLSKVYDLDGWRRLSETVEDSVRRVTDKMRSGYVCPDPMIEDKSSPCSYCKFKPICRNAKVIT